jgi:hypothetical protein
VDGQSSKLLSVRQPCELNYQQLLGKLLKEYLQQ